MLNTYIFDFDGTLVDSMKFWAGVHIKALTDNGINPPENFVETITTLGNLKASEYTISLGLDISLNEYIKKVNDELRVEYLHRVPLKPNVSNTLKILKNTSCSLNVLTASPHLYVDDCLKKLGVFECFDNIFTIDDFGHTKSEKIIYKKAAKKIGVDVNDCVFVDDNYIAIKTAKEAGMKTVAVYDDSSKNAITKLKSIADLYVFDFGEINTISTDSIMLNKI